MAQNKEFLVSSAVVKGFNPTTGAFMFSAETLVDSSISVSMTEQEARGGFQNQKLHSFFHSRTLEASLTAASWEAEYMAMNAGQLLQTGADSVYKFDECVTLTAGSGTVAETPIGNIFVKKPNGAVVEITPTGSSFTVPGLSNEAVSCTYKYSETISKVVIDTTTSPMVVSLVMQAKIFDNTGQIGVMEISIPRFQLNGSFEISLTSDGIASTPLSGMALAYSDANCTSGSVYANVRIIPVNGVTDALAGIAVIPGSFTITTATGTKQLSVIALPANATRANYNVDPTLVAWTSSAPAVATVGASTGIVTRISNGSAVISASYLGVTDQCNITTTA